MIKLLPDQGLPRSATQHLASAGIDAVHIGELGSPALAELLVLVLDRCRSELEAGALVTVQPRRLRVRLLPLLSNQPK
jgi:predicted nuclease of predicted toxin-antitoxin system